MKIRRFLGGISAVGLLTVAAGLAACGGSDSSSGGSDEAYVAAVCKASVKYIDAVAKVFGDVKEDASEADQAKAAAGPVEQFGKDLKAAKPPSDAKEYHNTVVKFYADATKRLKDGDGSVFDESPGDPPAAVAARLDKLAADNKDCQESDFTFSE
jgi:hypothetical protein